MVGVVGVCLTVSFTISGNLKLNYKIIQSKQIYKEITLS